MGERTLTVRDRIIVHLGPLLKYSDEYECPEEMSQAGISKAIGKSRAHTTLELNRMKADGLLSERLAHVRGAKSKRKTYSLTHMALAKERAIAEHINGMEIEIGGSIVNGHQAAETLMGDLSMSRPFAFDMILASGGKIALEDMNPRIGLDIDSAAESRPPVLDLNDCLSRDDRTHDAVILQVNILSKKGQPKEALALIEKIIASRPPEQVLSKAYYSRASIFRKLGDFPSALTEINKTLAIADGTGDSLMVGRCQMEKSMILSGTGNEPRALELLDSASEIFRRENSQVDLLRCGINKGIVLKDMGNITKAVTVLEDSLALAEKAGLDRLKAYAIVNLTDLLNRQEEYGRSRELVINARDIFTVLNEPLMLAASLFNLGTARAGLGQKEEAIEDLDSAISILESNDMLASRTYWLEKYARILEELGEPEKAKSIVRKI